MAQFYAHIQGSRGPASRLGCKASGIQASIKSWEGQVNVTMRARHVGRNDYIDWVRVVLEPHGGDATRYVVLYDGPANGWQDYHERGELGRMAWDAEHRQRRAA